jgi:hypothetical protein
LKNYPGIYLEELRKAMKNLLLSNRFADRDLNPGALLGLFYVRYSVPYDTVTPWDTITMATC